MKKKELSSDRVGCPWIFNQNPSYGGSYWAKEKYEQENVSTSLTLFDLSSHERVRQAIEFGLGMRRNNFHVYVLGDERSGRMTATLAYLRNYIKQFQAPCDWVYLNNFTINYRPIPFALPAGKGEVLREDLQNLIAYLVIKFQKAFHTPHYRKKIDDITYQLHLQWQENLANLHQEAANCQCRIVQDNENGYDVESANENGLLEDVHAMRRRLNYCIIQGQIAQKKTYHKIENWRMQAAKRALDKALKPFRHSWQAYLGSWIDELASDILDKLDLFSLPQDEALPDASFMSNPGLERYNVNILVDRSHLDHPKVVVEANPTYERLFGTIKYRNGVNGLEPHFTLIRGGALHEANGGILILRADALARAPEVWDALKVALRDRRIRIEERFRDNMLPLWDAPEPHTIPLDTQVFLVSSPDWYYDFFCLEPDFQNYFKIKADIDPDLPITPHNVKVYHQLIVQSAKELTGRDIEDLAVEAVLRQSTRWANHRHRFSSRFEEVTDMLVEASSFIDSKPQGLLSPIQLAHINKAIAARHHRESRNADRHFEHVYQEQILLDTQGSHVGQVNGLTILSTGDHSYGMPCRITARTYAGTQGVINIERLTQMGGAIQQKGMFILEAFLKGTFAQDFPLSSSCSITFEQNYTDVEGDSASLAELVAIISSLADLPVRQDIAITCAMNQWGHAHSVGGVQTKIEGFYKLCHQRGLTKTQGVVIPSTNEINLSLSDEVAQAIADGSFFIWSIHTIEQACEILMEQSWVDTILPLVRDKLLVYARHVFKPHACER